MRVKVDWRNAVSLTIRELSMTVRANNREILVVLPPSNVMYAVDTGT
jgi:hypothetical protein